MANEPEFRIGDVQTPFGGARRDVARGTALDQQVFPTLAELLGSADFRDRLDALVEETRALSPSDSEVRAALQVALRLLPVLKNRYGG